MLVLAQFSGVWVFVCFVGCGLWACLFLKICEGFGSFHQVPSTPWHFVLSSQVYNLQRLQTKQQMFTSWRWGRQRDCKVVTEERCQVYPRELSLLSRLCNSKWSSMTNQLVFPFSEIQLEYLPYWLEHTLDNLTQRWHSCNFYLLHACRY